MQWQCKELQPAAAAARVSRTRCPHKLHRTSRSC